MSVELGFDKDKSVVSRSPVKLKMFVRELERLLGRGALVRGILEIGSFTKGEAVPSSDSDLRIYVESEEVYFWQCGGSRQHMKVLNDKERIFRALIQEHGPLPHESVHWDDFNSSVSVNMSEVLSLNLEFGLADKRYADYVLSDLDNYPNIEYELLMQGDILYDPDLWLTAWKEKIFGVRYASLCAYYQERYLNKLPFEVYTHLEVSKFDIEKIEKSGQIPWVKWAVRVLRDAAATKVYQTTGRFIYKMPDVLNFYNSYLPQHLSCVKLLYTWKTDPAVRQAMTCQYQNDPVKLLAEFKNMMPGLERIVSEVNVLKL